LFVRIDEDDGVLELRLFEKEPEAAVGIDPIDICRIRVLDSFSIIAVDDKDDRLGPLIVMPPKGSDLVASSDVL
jgi:hypothetical protein